MRMARAFLFVCAALFLLALVPLATWSLGASRADAAERLIHLGMTEREVLYHAGVPDGVEVKMTWDRFAGMRASAMRFGGGHEYAMTYLPLRKGLAVLHGPLGDATQCSIAFEEDKVVAIDWTYRTTAGEAAKRALLRDATYAVRKVGVVLMGSKKDPEGDVTVFVQMANNAETSVSLYPSDGK